MESTSRIIRSIGVLVCLAASGCSFGPMALTRSHGQYNEAVKRVSEEELLLNIVRLRYNENPVRLDVSSIATQYELDASAEARPFFSTEADGGVFRSFSRVLPFGAVSGSNRPTISLTPLDDPETIRSLFTPSTLDGIIFLAETSWPIESVFRLWVEYLNRVPNAVTASGPTREIVPEFQTFQRIAQLLQALKDRNDIQFIREAKTTEIGSPLPAESITATALVEAAKSGYEYRQRPDKSWVLVKRGHQLSLRINSKAVASPEVQELCKLVHLKPGQSSYEVVVGSDNEPFELAQEADEPTTIKLFPRSVVQAAFYLSYGVLVPPAHLNCGIVKSSVEPDGTVFDWQQVTAGLFTVHSVKQHCRPDGASVAVKYRDYWFYIDDRDSDSKVSFALMMTMTRANLLGTRKGGPAFTLPAGR